MTTHHLFAETLLTSVTPTLTDQLLYPSLAGCISATIIVVITNINLKLIEIKKALLLIQKTYKHLSSSLVDNNYSITTPLCIECVKAESLFSTKGIPYSCVQAILHIYHKGISQPDLTSEYLQELENMLPDINKCNPRFPTALKIYFNMPLK